MASWPLFVVEKVEIRAGDGDFEPKDLVTDAGNAMDGLFFDRTMGADSIFGNRIPWRKRVFFSQEAGHMVSAMQTVVISSTPAGFCI
jgi:hypothetical protein